MSQEDDALLSEFINESREHLADIETDLLTIEGAGANIDEQLVNKVFRAAHSIKGGAGFFNLTKIQELAHKTENVLDMVRSREMVPNSEVINILLLAFDKLRDLINHHSESDQADISEIVVALTGLTTAFLPSDEKSSVTNWIDITVPESGARLQLSEFDLNHVRKSGQYVYLVAYDLIHDIHRLGKTPLDVFKSIIASGTILEGMLDLDSAGTLDDDPTSAVFFHIVFATIIDPAVIGSLCDVPPERIHLLFDPTQEVKPASKAKAAKVEVRPQASVPSPVAAPAEPERAPEAISESVKDGAAESSALQAGRGAVSDATLRVSVGLLESLMNLAGELVLGRNQLMEAIARDDRRSVLASSQRINIVTSELQETIMVTRMQPIGNIFSKFPRVVRDMAKELGKEITLQITGKDVEMDKTIVEGLSDPLTHMVRNAVDHGIESRDERVKARKSSTGVVMLKAYHEAGQVVIEISDDGKGLDPQRIGNSALTKGMVTTEQLKAMSEKEIMGLIFLPGLSTAEKVSDVSGRGVGMDVVKTNLDKLGGKVEIESELGKGTNFRIKLPLTLAIIPSLLVSVNEERFAIPQVSVNELIRIAADQIKKRIETVGDAEVLILRGSIIPIVHLAHVLEIGRTYIDPATGKRETERRTAISDRRAPKSPLVRDATVEEEDLLPVNIPRGEDRRYHAGSDMNIVVVSAGVFQYGLIVEELHDTVEIVVKPLGRHLKGLREYAGATIMGDGKVALILDVAGLAAKVGLTSLSGSSRAQELAQESQREILSEMHSLLLFRNAPSEQCAVPLNLVSRIEQIKTDQIESVGGKRTMQYRGTTLPLVTLKDAAEVEDFSADQDRVVIVFDLTGREIGLLAAKPVDVQETDAVIDQGTLSQKGIMGSTILNEETTLILDIFELVETVHPEWVKERVKPTLTVGAETVVLLAEDSDFFRAQVKKFIESDGYKVIAAVDGQEAWELLQKNVEKVKLVVTDIEMPRLTGLGLTQNIRADRRFEGLPIIALTSLASEDDIARGKAVGVDEYQIKLDKVKLLEGIKQRLQPAAEEI